MFDTTQSVELEKRHLRRLVRDYESQGYQVIIGPGADQTPALPTGYQPKAIALGNDELVVLEVMTTQSLMTAVYLADIAKIIQDHPGWRLELVLTNPKEMSLPNHNHNTYINRREMYVRIRKAQELLEAHYKDAALLLLCSVITAALMQLAQRERIALDSYDPIYILKHLAFLALVSREDYWLLRLALKLQASISSGIQCEELEENWLRKMFEAMMRLLQS